MLKERGDDPATTLRLLEGYANPETRPQAEQSLEERYRFGIQAGYVKPEEKQKPVVDKFTKAGLVPGTPEYIAAAKKDLQGDGQYRIATAEEKAAAGITGPEQYQISPKGQFVKLGGAGQTINVNIPGQGDVVDVGKPEAGAAIVRDPKTGKLSYQAIEGGPVANEAADKTKRESAQKATTAQTANIVSEDIGRFRNLLENESWYNPVTGVTGSVASNIPGTARADAEALKTTIAANIGFDRLQAMREASKTGGALGAISEREMKQLESVKGSIELSQSKEQLLKNLDRLDKIYSKILEKASAYPNAEKFGFGGAKAIPVNTPSQEMPEQIRSRYY